MSHQHENLLGRAASAYLRSARFQPVRWMEWGPEAFARAQAEDKAILLDIGAVWCHWCHVMDRESYENEGTAALINELFIPIKVDRDERPDVDSRYQSAVAAISGQGGWPLTAFLTPDGRPYFGGGYFPPEDRYGRPSLERVLVMMHEAFSQRRHEVFETAESVIAAIENNESFEGAAAAATPELLTKLIDSVLAQFDARNGGFGQQPKFPNSAAIDLLIDAASRPGHEFRGETLAPSATPFSNPRAAEVARITLLKMSQGGIHDQLAGGFHRYSTDERWIVPHFEKMAYDNSELLKNYAHAYSTFGDETFATTARSIVRWIDEHLSDRTLGGFYASQDADASLEDDGDYFTWTRSEAREALTPEEFAVAEPYFNLRPVGDMRHNPQKNVLHLGADVPTIARNLKLEETHVRELVAQASAKLYAARLHRRTPYIDRTLYTGWNAMCISAYFAAADSLRDPAIRAFALQSLDRLLSTAFDSELGLAHVIAYGEAAAGNRLAGNLDDYALTATAALDAWEATGELRFYTAAKSLTDSMLARFYDRDGGGAFFDTEDIPDSIGALASRRKPLQDSPTPSGNAVAVLVLLRIASLLTDGTKYEIAARHTLEAFAGVVEHFGLYAASYALALRRALEGPTQISILNSETLAEAAITPFAINKSIVRLTSLDALPPALAETLSTLPDGVAIVCKGTVCLPPIHSAADLKTALAT